MRVGPRSRYTFEEKTVSVGLASTAIVAADPQRIYLRLQVCSLQAVAPADQVNVWVSGTFAPAVADGIPVLGLTPLILDYESSGPFCQKAFNGIATTPINISVLAVMNSIG